MQQMGLPALEPLGQFLPLNQPLSIVLLKLLQASPGPPQVIIPHPNPDAAGKRCARGQDPKADKIAPIAGFKQLSFNGVQGQSQRSQVFFQSGPSGHQLRPIVAKQRKVIDVPQVGRNFYLLFDKMVEAVEVDVSEKLAGEIADRQAMATLQRGEQVIAGEILQHRFLDVTAVDDGIHQPQCLFALDAMANLGFEDFMVDRGKVFFQIALQNVGIRSGKLRKPLQGAMGAIAHPISVGIGNKAILKPGNDDVAKGVMDDPIGIGAADINRGLGS